jgi:hypothetical protein
MTKFAFPHRPAPIGKVVGKGMPTSSGKSMGGEGLRASGRGKAKGRSPKAPARLELLEESQ